LNYYTYILTPVVLAVFAIALHAQPTPIHTFTNPNSSNPDSFGSAVAIDGNYALVGARTDDTGATDAGRAFLYDLTTGNLLRAFADPNPAAGDNFGYSIAVKDDYVLIGAPSDTLV